MSKGYHCPLCKTEVDSNASVCNNPACRAEFAFCPHCRDVTTYVLVEEHGGIWKRDQYRCERCQRIGVKCWTWLSGGYCNGLAHTGRRLDRPFCPRCSAKAAEVGRSVLGWSIIGALGGLLRRKVL